MSELNKQLKAGIVTKSVTELDSGMVFTRRDLQATAVLMREAADEIDRLTKERDHWHQEFVRTVADKMVQP